MLKKKRKKERNVKKEENIKKVLKFLHIEEKIIYLTFSKLIYILPFCI